MIKKIDYALLSINKIIHGFGSVWFFSAMLFLVFLSVFFRYIFNSPLLWSDEIAVVIFAFTIFSSIIACWDEGRHIRMDIIYRNVPYRIRWIVDIIDAAAGAIIFILLAYQCYDSAVMKYVTNEIGEQSSFPLWTLNIYMMIVAGLFAAKLITVILKTASNFYRGKSSDKTDPVQV